MKTIADLRKEFKQQHKIDAQQFTRHANERTYSLDYVHWLEDIVLRQANGQSTGEGQSNIPVVSGSLPLECEIRTPIENALYATGKFTTDECTYLAEGILQYLVDAKMKVVWR